MGQHTAPPTKNPASHLAGFRYIIPSVRPDQAADADCTESATFRYSSIWSKFIYR